MATQLTKQLIDDLDGSVAVNTVRFTWQGQPFELDLSKKNTTAFEKAIKPYVEHARRVRPSSKAGGRRRVTAANSAENLAEIRAWARANGYEVSDRGRIAGAVVEAFDAAH